MNFVDLKSVGAKISEREQSSKLPLSLVGTDFYSPCARWITQSKVRPADTIIICMSMPCGETDGKELPPNFLSEKNTDPMFLILQGCDASIMLNGPNSELVSDNNFGIRRLDFIDNVKSTMETMCAKTVSCADIIALAGREAVFHSGGPDIQIPLGRKDSASASNFNADKSLPSATSSVSSMLSLFGTFGMTTEESLAILGRFSQDITHTSHHLIRHLSLLLYSAAIDVLDDNNEVPLFFFFCRCTYFGRKPLREH